MMWKEQKKILDNFYKKYGKFRVAANTQFGWSYFDYKSDNALYMLKRDDLTDRDIMKDEIVIETDMPMRKMNTGASLQHERKLRRNGIGYTKWFSGNKSYHIQTHFEELMNIKNDYDLKLLKKSFMLWLYGFDEDKSTAHKLDIQLSGKHLIRLEHSWHPNTMQRKTLYSENETDRNKLPTIVIEYYLKEKDKHTNIKSTKEVSVFNKPCIMDIYLNSLEDGRHRAAFIIFNNFKKEFGVEKAAQLLREWYNNKVRNSPRQQGDKSQNSLLSTHIERIITYGSKNNRSPSCPYIKDFMSSIGKKTICNSCPCNGENK